MRSPLTPFQFNVLATLQAKVAVVSFYPAEHEGKNNNADVRDNDAIATAGFYGGLVEVRRRNGATAASVIFWERIGPHLVRQPETTECPDLSAAVTFAKKVLAEKV